METEKKEELYREKSSHGSVLFPFECYIQDSEEPMMVKNYHWHEEVEWIYMIEGSVRIEIDMETYYVHENMLVCIPKGALHKIQTEGKCFYYAFVYKFQFLQFSLYDYCESVYMGPAEQGEIIFAKIIDLSLPEHQSIQTELRQIAQHYIQRTETWRLQVKASLLKIVALLIQNKALEDTDYKSQNNMIDKITNMKRLLQYIKEHYQEKIYIKELADIVNMNENYFCKYFKNIVGKTPIEYINNLRIEQAAKLIRETDHQIIEICFMVGFDNVSYFIRKFKENKHITPKKYSQSMDNRV
ncbi:MAG: AraC family transcriptional regulator [Lachnospiraceae bacterium]|nr:AraC family transcriptional regulator [Lachnospiraceae bacterium]